MQIVPIDELGGSFVTMGEGADLDRFLEQLFCTAEPCKILHPDEFITNFDMKTPAREHCFCRECLHSRIPWAGIDQHELAALCYRLDVSLPVNIQGGIEGCLCDNPDCPSKTPRFGTMGAHGFRDNAHLVMIDESLTAAAANECLVHELTHARQMEMAGGFEVFTKEYAAYERSYGYAENPFEIEAVATARKLHDAYEVFT